MATHFKHRSISDVGQPPPVLWRLLLVILLTCISQQVVAQTGVTARPLFDGQTLEGWEGDRGYWRVEGGVIVGEIPAGQSLRKNTWLVWRDGEVADFDLRLEVKLTGSPRANSGIQFRCQVQDIDHVSGYQADLDQGAVWLGRIYDEHGRALLTERGTRVKIAADGTRQVEVFAPAEQYRVLFRQNDWNDYRIIAKGNHVRVVINGTQFCELHDSQSGERDLRGSLAFQLHSGPRTRVEFRNIRLEKLRPDDDRLPPFTFRESTAGTDDADSGDTNSDNHHSQAAWRSTHNPLLQHLVPNRAGMAKVEPGGDTIATMHVPSGFSVDVVAAEPRLHQPMAFTFDEKGRLWVVEGHSYPKKRPPGEGLDRVLIFSDQDGDGSFESQKVFLDGLNLVSGLEVGYGGIWIGAAPELLFVPDRDGDDRPDSEPQVLLNGFGYADTHETLNSMIWGPDGWLYGNQGVFNASKIGKPGSSDQQRQQLGAGVWRYHPTRHDFEVFAHGGSNQWGLDFDEFGQLFMTHCRSRWGKGPTTHVLQGGHYWNQVNGGYAPYISATAPPEIPELKNFMLASARYGHGEGGAGQPGSRAVFGGHSHVGTMIYLGDNWPDQFRNHLFTHNLHGHQMNHQINRRAAGGFQTVHAGRDMFFCEDRQYIGVDLKYGPDGAVYISDWYDPRHCHNPDVEQWDRGNGRLYRMQFDATYQPVVVDYTTSSDEQLVDAQLLLNDWHVRTARRELSQRRERRKIAAAGVARLESFALNHADPARRLRGLWALHAVRAINADMASRLMRDENEFVRGWTVQLAVETLQPGALSRLLVPLARQESSLLVRRYLATAIRRVPTSLGWNLIEILGEQRDVTNDRDLTLLLWYGLAEYMPANLDRAIAFAERTPVAPLRNLVPWYAARLSPAGRELVVRQLAAARAEERSRLLSLLAHGVRGMRGLPEPSSWSLVADELYDSSNLRARRDAELIGAALGDEALFQRMREMLAQDSAESDSQRHAVSILANDAAPQNLPLLQALLDTDELVSDVLPLLTRYDDPSVAEALIVRFPEWSGQNKLAAMEVLSSRPAWAMRVLDCIATGELERDQLTAYFVRQMSSLSSPEIHARLARDWGALKQSSAQRRDEIQELVAQYESAPLWAYNAANGAAHFKRLCASCHQPDQQDESLGPRLAGSRSKGIRYAVENVIDPNAVIGRDYQARIVVTRSGRVINGLIESESESAVTVRTATNRVTIARSEIDDIVVSDNSFMPEGLLKDLNDRERIELFKYLMTQ